MRPDVPDSSQLQRAWAFPFTHSPVKHILAICDAQGTLLALGPLVLVDRHALVVKGDRQIVVIYEKVHSHELEKEANLP